MIPKLTSAEYLRDYTIRLEFADGVVGDVDLRAELWGEVFEPLQDVELFRRFRLDDELNTIVWPSGADMAPEFLHERATQNQVATKARRVTRG
ncbi:MAG: DUF2442 domain-containing protein [Planctomycetes bacterium]|nr:DUF2442 domain-containing protein [Planctomycetota bacterium]